MPSLIGRCGGGGITRWTGIYSGPPATAAGGGGAASLSVNTRVSGDAVLTGGAVNKTGNWAITAVVATTAGSGFPTASTYYAQLDATDTGSGSIGQSAFNSGTANAINPQAPVTLALTMWLTSGSTFTIAVTNAAAGDVDFELGVVTIAFLGGS